MNILSYLFNLFFRRNDEVTKLQAEALILKREREEILGLEEILSVFNPTDYFYKTNDMYYSYLTGKQIDKFEKLKEIDVQIERIDKLVGKKNVIK